MFEGDLCEIQGESVLESSRNRKSKEREREIAEEMIRNELEKEKDGR